jgi:glucose-6-phosphate 1-epimerase
MNINLIGAQLISAEIFEGINIFYLSPFSKNNNISRGGVPIIFPQFGYAGLLKKHGFARELSWVELESSLTKSEEIAKYELEINPFSLENWKFKAKLFLTCKLIKRSSLSINLQIQNTGDKSFLFTGGLHPYFSIKSRKDLEISGLENTPYLDTDPFITSFVLNDNTGIERLFYTNSNLQINTGFGKLNLTVVGFENWMVWNPGIKGAKNIDDLPDTDWDKFVCIEPLVNKNGVNLEPNEFFNGELIIKRV